jgi:hypothetical protein
MGLEAFVSPSETPTTRLAVFRLLLVGATSLFWLIGTARIIFPIAVCENRSPGQKARIK